jgi:hypothetical protein
MCCVAHYGAAQLSGIGTFGQGTTTISTALDAVEWFKQWLMK